MVGGDDGSCMWIVAQSEIIMKFNFSSNLKQNLRDKFNEYLTRHELFIDILVKPIKPVSYITVKLNA